MGDFDWNNVNENTSISDSLGIDKRAPKINITDSPWEHGGDGEETIIIKPNY